MCKTHIGIFLHSCMNVIMYKPVFLWKRGQTLGYLSFSLFPLSPKIYLYKITHPCLYPQYTHTHSLKHTYIQSDWGEKFRYHLKKIISHYSEIFAYFFLHTVLYSRYTTKTTNTALI